MKLVNFACLTLVVMSAASPALGQAAEKFDLVCVGTTTDRHARPETTKKWETRYSIDLAANKFCPASAERRCKAPLPIHAVEPHRLVLSESEKMIGGDRVANSLTVSRADGVLRSSAIMPGVLYVVIDAQCTPAPFTELPSTLF